MPNPKKTLGNNAIDVWCFKRSHGPNLSLHPKEEAMASSYYSPLQQIWYRHTLGNIKTILGYYLKLPASHLWTFDRTAEGKPYLKNHPDCHFNWSHSQDELIFAINFNNPLGIDIEHQKQIDYLKIAKTCFSQEELNYLEASRAYQQSLAFFKLWTLKEACIKATGSGFSSPSNDICILKPEIKSISHWWMPKPGIHAALCSTKKITDIQIYKKLINTP